MTILQNRSDFISRIFTDLSGRKFRLTFLVSIVGGEVRGRLVSAEPISTRPTLADLTNNSSYPCYVLPIICSEKIPDTKYVSSFAPVATPYFSIDFLINCQPTRAPAK